MAVYSKGHICLCLGRMEAIREDAPVVICERRRRTGRDLVAGVRSLARGLAHSGVARGDVVAVAALNSDWYMELFLAITYIGGIAAPLNHRWSFEEAKMAIEFVKPKMLAVDEHCSLLAIQMKKSSSLSSIKQYVFIGNLSPGVVCSNNYLAMDLIRRLGQTMTIGDPICAPDEIALICFTSGSTGKPKGVAISHTALIVQSLAKIAIVGYGEDDVYLHTAPLCHIGGISSCMAMLLAGGCHIFIPKFDAGLTFEAINNYQVTSFITVPAMMADLIEYERKFKMSSNGKSVLKVLNGGGSLPEELMIGANCLFPHAKIFSAYGMTETCSSLTFMTLFDPTVKDSMMSYNDSINVNPAPILGGVRVGKPAPHVELKITGDNDSTPGPFVGNIMTRGLHVMVRYWNSSEVTTTRKGWFDTGDIGWLDGQGELWLIGRRNDRIKTGGENVYPEEVEAVISQHPGISKVVVVGVPDIRLTEKVVACLNIKEGWKWVDQNANCSQEEKQVSTEILQNFCRQRNLSRFKIPKVYTLWRKPFPLTTTGKLRRDDVRKEIMSLMQLPSNL
ncbi:hypothetical protein Cni_G20781 [Canna indica]|uniref:4-coumarate--CoA ligase n=1 Tax=Canna indica TaxID=4628 RepID=A0AAQ3KUL9_9LILI|nr:hypothetical protein Cni_G20781 [Canna indica]